MGNYDKVKEAAKNLYDAVVQEGGFVLAITGNADSGDLMRMMNGMGHDIIAALTKTMLDDAECRKVIEDACVVMTKVEMDRKMKTREI